MLDEQLVGDVATDVLTDSARIFAHSVEFASGALQPLELDGVGWRRRLTLAVLMSFTSRQDASVTPVSPHHDTFFLAGLTISVEVGQADEAIDDVQ